MKIFIDSIDRGIWNVLQPGRQS